MPIKKLLYRFQPAPLYIVLILSICYFSVQLILSHITHALTLLMASYHMLCNIFALAGSIVTIKHNLYSSTGGNDYFNNEYQKTNVSDVTRNKSDITQSDQNLKAKKPTMLQMTEQEEEAKLTIASKRREIKIRNTFGWARIEILTMLIVCITLISLSFSLLVEGLQTLVHIDHQDTMHLPMLVTILGLVGLLLNGFTYLTIGGYTLHQGNFLHITPAGAIVQESNTYKLNLSKENSLNETPQLKNELKKEFQHVYYNNNKRQGAAELLRDVSSTIFVIVCGIIVHFAADREHTAKFIDPMLSIFSCVLVVALSYPYMKEACLILLQTIPDTIDMDNFERSLISKFPQIVSYHDLHIWQLSSHNYIATVHIVFQNPNLYNKTIDDVSAHFHEYRIAHVTIQPEFSNGKTPSLSTECLMHCTNPECIDKVCCKDSLTDLTEISVCPAGEMQVPNKKSNGKCKIKHQAAKKTSIVNNGKIRMMTTMPMPMPTLSAVGNEKTKPLANTSEDTLQNTNSHETEKTDNRNLSQSKTNGTSNINTINTADDSTSDSNDTKC
uniref:Cation efflux protein cytoplasmic domain-containing protein n=1 Tax=Glossina brevipalpis TaxID=37001 RepID=A0A1A9WH67_9MUSC